MRYGQWAGNPDGFAEIVQRCIATVWSPIARGGTQCSRKRGHGFDGMYCKQHAKIEEERRAWNKRHDR